MKAWAWEHPRNGDRERRFRGILNSRRLFCKPVALPLSERTASVTQRMELLGENAAACVDEIQSAFEPNLAPGMRRIAQAIERHHNEPGAALPSAG
jgi:hypothetical protein